MSDVEYAKGFYGPEFDVNRLTLEATVGLSKPLDPVTMTMLEDGNLTDALRNYAKSAPNPSIAKMAKALSRLAGTTRAGEGRRRIPSPPQGASLGGGGRCCGIL